MSLKRTVLPCFAAVILLFTAVHFSHASDDAGTQQLSIEQRVRNTIKRSKWLGRDGFTNERKANDEFYRIVKAATAESLRRPTVGSCWYWPQSAKDGKVHAKIQWIEDRPHLAKVTFRNPDLDREEVVALPQSSLEYKLQHEMDGISFAEVVEFSVDLIGDSSSTQALEVFADEQEVPATCYPSTALDSKKQSGQKN